MAENIRSSQSFWPSALSRCHFIYVVFFIIIVCACKCVYNVCVGDCRHTHAMLCVWRSEAKFRCGLSSSAVGSGMEFGLSGPCSKCFHLPIHLAGPKWQLFLVLTSFCFWHAFLLKSFTDSPGLVMSLSGIHLTSWRFQKNPLLMFHFDLFLAGDGCNDVLSWRWEVAMGFLLV